MYITFLPRLYGTTESSSAWSIIIGESTFNIYLELLKINLLFSSGSKTVEVNQGSQANIYKQSSKKKQNIFKSNTFPNLCKGISSLIFVNADSSINPIGNIFCLFNSETILVAKAVPKECPQTNISVKLCIRSHLYTCMASSTIFSSNSSACDESA